MLTKLYTFAQAYTTKDDGATAIEYGLIAAGIAVAIVALVFTLGDQIESGFQSVSDELTAEGLTGE